MALTDEILWWMPLDYMTRIKKPFKKLVLSALSTWASFTQVLGKMNIVKGISNPIAFIDSCWLMLCYWILISICFKIKIGETVEAILVCTLKEAFDFWYWKCFETFANIVNFFFYTNIHQMWKTTMCHTSDIYSF